MNIEQIYDQKVGEKSDINEHLPTLRRYAGFCQHVTEFGVRTIVSTWALIAARPKFVISYNQSHPGIPAIAQVTEIANEASLKGYFVTQQGYPVHLLPGIVYRHNRDTEEQLAAQAKL